MPSAAFLRMPSGRFSLKNVRTSWRNAFSSGVKRRSMILSFVMRGLDPRIHRLAMESFRWIAGSSPAMTPDANSVNLEQPRRAHPAADAHGDDRMPGAAPLAFDQDMPRHARAAHAERMADGDRATVHVELLHRDAEPVAAVEHLAGECLVQFPQVDVIHRLAGAGQQLRHR